MLGKGHKEYHLKGAMPAADIGTVTDRTYKGILYDSTDDARFFKENIEPMVAIGYIKTYSYKKKFILQESFRYNGKIVSAISCTANFSIEYTNGIEEAVMIVSHKMLKEERLMQKLFWHNYPKITARWVRYDKEKHCWIDNALHGKS